VTATSSQRRRVERALGEIEGVVSEPLAPARLAALLERAMDRYLDVSTMGPLERWTFIGPVEMEVLLVSLEERAAIVHDGPWRPRRVEGEERCERRTAT
jgi:hypothetical protein